MNRRTLKKYLIGDFTLRRLVRSFVFIYLCLAVYAFFWSDRMIFLPQLPMYEDSEDLIIYGRSVGGGPALYLAQNRDEAGVIVESSFVTAFRTVTRIPLLPFDKFRNIDRIAEVNCPVLIIHGLEDRTIPPWHGKELFDEAREPKTSCWLERTSHNRMPGEDAEKYREALVGFRESLE